MSPNHQLVADIAADGRFYIALGFVVMVAMLAGMAWLLGRSR